MTTAGSSKTSPAKSTPAKAAPAKAAKKAAEPAFDFAAIPVADGAAPTRQGSRTAGPNPFIDHLRASAAERTDKGKGAWIGKGKTLTVPLAAAKQAVNLIRYAANRLNMGAAVSDIEDKTYHRPGGMVQINFAAKNRKLKKTAPAAPAAPATPAS